MWRSWLAHLVWDQRVLCSSHSTPTRKRRREIASFSVSGHMANPQSAEPTAPRGTPASLRCAGRLRSSVPLRLFIAAAHAALTGRREIASLSASGYMANPQSAEPTAPRGTPASLRCAGRLRSSVPLRLFIAAAHAALTGRREIASLSASGYMANPQSAEPTAPRGTPASLRCAGRLRSSVPLRLFIAAAHAALTGRREIASFFCRGTTTTFAG